MWQRLQAAQLPALDGQTAKGLPKELRFYKYSVDQLFKMHKDGSWIESGMSSNLAFMVYLNDDFVGGETDFRDFKINPVKDTELLFIHDIWHEGCNVTQGIKHVVRSVVLYGVDVVVQKNAQSF